MKKMLQVWRVEGLKLAYLHSSGNIDDTNIFCSFQCDAWK